MANQLGTNPIVIDSVMAAPFNLGAAVHVNSLVWSGMTATHKLTIVDKNGNTILDLTAGTVEDKVITVEGWWANGFKITVLGSGKVHIFM